MVLPHVIVYKLGIPLKGVVDLLRHVEEPVITRDDLPASLDPET